MISAKQRAALYDHRFQFLGAIPHGTRTQGIAWLPNAFFPSVTERCIYSGAPIVVLERHDCARIGRTVTLVINRMMGADHGND